MQYTVEDNEHVLKALRAGHYFWKIKVKDIQLDCEALVNDENDRGVITTKYIHRLNVDLLVTGLKEKSDSSAFFIHRITENIRAQNLRLPFWVVKETRADRGMI